eukprot:GFUD01005647.1.p1 GENE.GFUD01005647.1~~GFUD01005647.1.p1  ORF type:complete len:242 (-),score=53.41 GFUD01005647.1:20-745(-)
MTQLKICTFNVHGFSDARDRSGFDRIVKVITEQQPDVLCLQESDTEELPKFKSALQFEHLLKWRGCSILSNLPVEEFGIKERRPRFLTAKVTINKKTLYVTCCHLDYRIEPTRMKELEQMEKRLQGIFQNKEAQIWTGDFNSLTREDYNEEVWEEITQVRRQNRWELPRTEVTTQMTRLGFKDCWSEVGKPEPTSTCRFSTHIDYVFANEEARTAWECVEVLHVDSDASDHKPVFVTFREL